MTISARILGFGLAALAVPALAAIAPGVAAPDFSTKAAIGGKEVNISLKAMLKNGPVVLYFFPKAFTPGCTLEAHQFAEKVAAFGKYGATVIGASADTIEELKSFSVKECSSKFHVAMATPAIIKAYDVAHEKAPVSNRTSFVIARNGKIAYTYSSPDYREHVANTLAAVQKLSKAK